MEKQLVSRVVSNRRKWSKFGVSKGLPPGPDSASTHIVKDEVFFEPVIKSVVKDDSESDILGGVNIFNSSGSKKIKCKYCGGSHFSIKCPNKSNSSHKPNYNNEKIIVKIYSSIIKNKKME